MDTVKRKLGEKYKFSYLHEDWLLYVRQVHVEIVFCFCFFKCKLWVLGCQRAPWTGYSELALCIRSHTLLGAILH